MITGHRDPIGSEAPVAAKGRILITSDDESLAQGLAADFKKSNLKSKKAKDFKSACNLLKSGKFQVIFSTPRLTNGSWRKLMEFAHGNCLAPSFVIVARSFDLGDWTDCLNNGAFEVLDAISEISRASEVARQAISTNFAGVALELEKANGSQPNDYAPFKPGCPELAT